MKNIQQKQKPVAIDLFAGAGGFSLAAVNAGFSLALAIENDAYAVKTYKKNIVRYAGAKDDIDIDKSILKSRHLIVYKEHFAGRG